MSYLREAPLDEDNYPLFAAIKSAFGFVPNFYRAQTMRPDLVEARGGRIKAVGQGLARSARTITSAALIMVAVFSVFAGIAVPSLKEIGLGLAVAIALDATVVRLVLVPAFMEIMGGWNWWLRSAIWPSARR